MADASSVSLSRSQDIAFNKLILSERNVRRARIGVSITELAEDIANRTLLQSLSVRPVVGEDGGLTDLYEVQAGGRRYRALALLVKQKRLDAAAPIPCIVREAGLLEEDSLAENVQREALHPLDQFRAFQTLVDQGLAIDEIAARFFVTAKTVRQRLKLAGVSAKLLEIYEDDGLSLEQLMAFTVTDSHDRQEQVWDTVSRGFNHSAHYIRRLLTEENIDADDRRAVFVGIKAYEAAGGTVLRDLFSEDGEGWLEDGGLLERLVAEKLEAQAAAVRAEGWKWVETATEFAYGHTSGLQRMPGEPPVLCDDGHARREALRDEIAQIEDEYFDESAEEIPEEIERRLAQAEEELHAFELLPRVYEASDIARAGAFISIDAVGRLKVERGYIRPEDAVQRAETGSLSDHLEIIHVGADGKGRSVDPAVVPGGGPGGGGAGDEDQAPPEEEPLKPLSERLVMELTAARTLALRDALGRDPDMAFLAVLHSLVLQCFCHQPSASCLEIRLQSPGFGAQAPGLGESASAVAIEARHESWEKRLPDNPGEVRDWLGRLDRGDRMELFAHCAGLSVNAVHEPGYGAQNRRASGDALAQSVGLDMVAAGWVPDGDNYLARVPKARILEAVTEAKGPDTAALIDHLKKGDMASEAARLLSGTGWLPEPLRTPGAGSMPGGAPTMDGDAATPPDVQPGDQEMPVQSGAAPGDGPDAEPAPDAVLPEFLTAAD